MIQAVIDRDGCRHPVTIPLDQLISIERVGELLREHDIPWQDRMELTRVLRSDKAKFSKRLLSRADGRYRRFWETAIEEMESAVDAA